MAFTIKRRGKVTYYSEGERPVLSALVTEEQPDGDLKIYFSGLTGGYSARGVLGLDELVSMDPQREVPLGLLGSPLAKECDKFFRQRVVCVHGEYRSQRVGR